MGYLDHPSADADAGDTSSMIRALSILVVFWCGICAVPVHADTGQLREVVTTDGINVVIFTSPTPLRAGEIEVAALVTDAVTGAPLNGVELEVMVRDPSWDPDMTSMRIAGGIDPTDPLRSKAVFDLPQPGDWEILIEVQYDGTVVPITLELSAGDRMPRWWQILPVALIGAPFAVLVVVRDRLRQSANRL